MYSDVIGNILSLREVELWKRSLLVRVHAYVEPLISFSFVPTTRSSAWLQTYGLNISYFLSRLGLQGPGLNSVFRMRQKHSTEYLTKLKS